MHVAIPIGQTDPGYGPVSGDDWPDFDPLPDFDPMVVRRPTTPATMPLDVRHTHPDGAARFTHVGHTERAPVYHVFRCVAAPDCPATRIHPCRRALYPVGDHIAPDGSVCRLCSMGALVAHDEETKHEL